MRFSSVIIAVTLLASTAMAQDSFLQRFHQDPASVYSEIPEKTGAKVQQFNMTDVLTKNYTQAKNQVRESLCDGDCTDTSRMKTSQNYMEGLGDFLGGQEAYLNIIGMDILKLTSGQASKSIWSGSYWPLYKGGLAHRYNDPRFKRDEKDFRRNRRRTKFPPRTRRDRHIQRMAPAEKYDFIMGDTNFSLTARNWDRGQWYYDNSSTSRRRRDKKVLPWMGYCHGWAVAAINEPRPKKSVTVLAPSGQKVTFTPSDIKGLASVLWGSLKSEDMHYEGSICRQRRPKVERGTGRIVDPKCFDVNPALFHTVLANYVGFQKRSFVFDAHWDFEIWNHPIASYSYTYFDPQTKKETTDINQAIITKAQFSRDPFKVHRSPNAEKYVGIKLKLKFVNLRGASASAVNSSRTDSFKTVTYYYDLELTDKGKILGGEWYQRAHPDMMWVNKLGRSPIAQTEVEMTSKWARGRSVPAEWRGAAPAASRKGDPLRAVVDQLIKWSQ